MTFIWKYKVRTSENDSGRWPRLLSTGHQHFFSGCPNILGKTSYLFHANSVFLWTPITALSQKVTPSLTIGRSNLAFHQPRHDQSQTILIVLFCSQHQHPPIIFIQNNSFRNTFVEKCTYNVDFWNQLLAKVILGSFPPINKGEIVGNKFSLFLNFRAGSTLWWY